MTCKQQSALGKKINKFDSVCKEILCLIKPNNLDGEKRQTNFQVCKFCFQNSNMLESWFEFFQYYAGTSFPYTLYFLKPSKSQFHFYVKVISDL